ncbi:hypothetical protein BDN72DRAFT_905061 [Pluteus cervinus]|uniref:Uncharacterized protein n=1 Tax=Pluteus cervinus TaxID=181527 RepID=A0ACD3A4J8_9AGAR|nr:hypothetical protein BDN72DRAFT_905061 [Pluteus cervinus]
MVDQYVLSTLTSSIQNQLWGTLNAPLYGPTSTLFLALASPPAIHVVSAPLPSVSNKAHISTTSLRSHLRRHHLGIGQAVVVGIGPFCKDKQRLNFPRSTRKFNTDYATTSTTTEDRTSYVLEVPAAPNACRRQLRKSLLRTTLHPHFPDRTPIMIQTRYNPFLLYFSAPDTEPVYVSHGSGASGLPSTTNPRKRPLRGAESRPQSRRLIPMELCDSPDAYSSFLRGGPITSSGLLVSSVSSLALVDRDQARGSSTSTLLHELHRQQQQVKPKG